MGTTTTHIETVKRFVERSQIKLVPALRFKEFDEEWQKISFGKLAEFKNGLNFSKEQEGVGLKVIGVGDFKNHMSIAYDELSKVNVPANQKEAFLLKDNDILFVRSNGNKELIGRALFLNNVKEELGYSGFTIRARFISFKDIHPYFYAIYFKSSAPKQQFLLLGGGTNISNLNQQILSGLEMPKPSLPEQQKIASFLSAVDEKIQQLSKKKALLEQYKKGLVQQLFSRQLRFKDENGNPYPDWEDKKLKDVLYEHKTKNKDGSVTEVFSVAKKKGVVNQISHLGRSYAADSTLHYKVAFPGDLIYTKSPTKDFPFGIIKQNLTGRKGLVSPLYVVTKPQTDSLGFMFHCYFLSWVNVYNYLVPLVQKGAKNTMNINNDDFLNGAKFMLPVSEKEQQKIATYLSSIDSKIESVTHQITQTQSFKKGLLQQMFV